jgi:hypothetical protein
VNCVRDTNCSDEHLSCFSEFPLLTVAPTRQLQDSTLNYVTCHDRILLRPSYFDFDELARLPPCRINLPEKLTGPLLVKKFPAFYKTRKFMTTFTSVRQPFHILNQRYLLHVSPSHFLKIYFNIILPSKPKYSKWFLSIRCPHQNPVRTASFPIGATHSAHYILLYLPF